MHYAVMNNVEPVYTKRSYLNYGWIIYSAYDRAYLEQVSSDETQMDYD